MADILHKDLIGADLHIPKVHASSHQVSGSDPIPELNITVGKVLTVDKTITLTAPNDTSVTTLPAGVKTLLAVDGSAASLTNFPTFNQNTTGTSAKWTNARLLAGNSVDGSANVTFANKFIVQGTTDAGLSSAQFLGALGTGIVKNTTTTGVLSIAVAGDFPTLNQNTTGSAATLTTPRAINGIDFNGSAAITIPSNITPGTPGNVLTSNGTIWTSAAPATNGTVTKVSVITADGISGEVATDTTTPEITLTLGAIIPVSVNGLTLAAQTTGFTIIGGTTPKTFTVSNSLTLTATDGSTLAIGTGGTLGTAAYTAAGAYEASGAIAIHAAILTGVHGLAITAGKVLTVQDNVTITGALGTGAYATIADYALVGQTMYIGTTAVVINRGSAALVLTGITSIDGSSGSCTGNAATVTNATFTTALTVNTGTLTLTANVANNSVLTIGAGAVSVSGANTGDQDLSGYALVGQTFYIGTTQLAINRASAALTLAGITLTTPDIGVATATSLATSAASPLLMTYGKLVTITLTTQTVNPVILTIPNFASVNDTFVFATLAQTLSNKTFVAPILGTPASGTLTNCTGGAATTAATVTGAAQPNITSVGVLTQLAVLGDGAEPQFTNYHAAGAGVTSLLLLSNSPDNNASDQGAIKFYHYDRGNVYGMTVARIVADKSFDGVNYGGSLWFQTKTIDTSKDTLPTTKMTITNCGNITLGGTAVRGTTIGTAVLHIFDGTAPTGTLANGCSIYSTSGELYTMDAAGNATLQTPHKNGLWIFDSKNTITGKRLVIDVEKILRKLNDKFGWNFVHDLMEN
jgi:hypothetical protein